MGPRANAPLRFGVAAHGGRVPQPSVRCASMGIEARLRATEQRVAAANGIDVQERWVDIASPSVRVRVLEAGSGDPVMFINGISAVRLS